MTGSDRLRKLWRILVRFGLWWAGLFRLVGTGMGKFWRILARFGLWWAGLFGLLGAGTCPICGRPGCPGGAAGMGLHTAVAAGLLTLFPWADRRSQKAARRKDEDNT
jgi:hypothetical protein